MGKALILIVEDDPVVMTVLTSKLEAYGYEVVGANTSTAAVHAAQKTRPDLMILDLRLADDDPFNSIRDGFGVLGWLHRVLPDASFPVIIHTMDDSPETLASARANGAYAIFKKGDNVSDLLATVRQALAETKAA